MTELTVPQLQYFEVMESLFAHPGWQLVMEDMEGMKQAIGQQWRTCTPEALRFEQGRYEGLEQITSLEAMTLAARDKLENPLPAELEEAFY